MIPLTNFGESGRYLFINVSDKYKKNKAFPAKNHAIKISNITLKAGAFSSLLYRNSFGLSTLLLSNDISVNIIPKTKKYNKSNTNHAPLLLNEYNKLFYYILA